MAVEFLAYLEATATDEATAELLRIPGLVSALRRAERDIAAGNLADWRKVRSDV